MRSNRDLRLTIHHSSIWRPPFVVAGQVPPDDSNPDVDFLSRLPGAPSKLLVLLFDTSGPAHLGDTSGPAHLGAHLAHADSIVSTLRWTEPV